ncbi:signal transduction histidine kinase [Wenyingzhuangia heitensis]|uniref:histidine kinase n=1 Tax=Wenyingzhuangia heitensis TaxID=1487859 RepID=A0ABX0UEA2_9FLAO|nr:HAMP domain-containing sensor histidine kinase [Wenyingzhuangia heitensis]NIJ45377.1 signal transduction histidine kinase [Wenyingzhuangia heitensis]
METNNIQNLLNSDFIHNAIIEQSPTAIIIATAPKVEIVYANKAAWNFTGDKAPLTNKMKIESCKAYYPNGKLYSFDEMPIVRSLTTGEFVCGEQVLVEFDNSVKKWALTYTHPISKNNKIIAAIAIFSDITNIINSNTELKEANRNKLRILGIIAHDLKTPFNALIGFSELLINSLKNKDFETAEEYAHIIKNSAKTAYTMTNDLIDWASNTASIRYNQTPLNVLSFIQKITQQLQASAIKKNILIILNVNATLKISFNENALGIALRNILSNAIKFSYNNSTIKIDVKNQDTETIFSIADYGVGIPEKRKKTILVNPKSNHSTVGTNGETGSGLGLCVTKEMILKHKGKLWVESEMNKGTTFYFSIPTH